MSCKVFLVGEILWTTLGCCMKIGLCLAKLPIWDKGKENQSFFTWSFQGCLEKGGPPNMDLLSRSGTKTWNELLLWRDCGTILSPFLYQCALNVSDCCKCAINMLWQCPNLHLVTLPIIMFLIVPNVYYLNLTYCVVLSNLSTFYLPIQLPSSLPFALSSTDFLFSGFSIPCKGNQVSLSR